MKWIFPILIAFLLCLGCAQSDFNLPMKEAPWSAVVGGELPDSTMPGWASVVMISRNNQHHCTGTLIAPRVVLTAGHCLSHTLNMDLEVRFAVDETETRSVVASRIHPQYRDGDSIEEGLGRNNGVHDLALLMIDEKAPVAAVIAILPTGPVPVETKMLLRVFGAGRTGMKNKDGGVLRTTEVEGVVEAKTPLKINIDQRLGKGVCHGDSGGPSFKIENSQAVLLGVTSGADRWQTTENGGIQGDVCRYFSISTQVGAYLDWITETSAELKSVLDSSNR